MSKPSPLHITPIVNYADYLRYKSNNRSYGQYIRKTEQRIPANNGEEVAILLSSYGFQTVSLSEFTVAEQAAILAQARLVVGVHGAALTNIVFASEGTKIIELFSPAYVSPYYWRMSSQNNLEYYYLVCNELEKDVNETTVNRLKNLHVDLNSLSQILDLARF